MTSNKYIEYVHVHVHEYVESLSDHHRLQLHVQHIQNLYLDQTAGGDHYHLVNQGTALWALSLKIKGICID